MNLKKKKPLTLGINYKENKFDKIVKIVMEDEHIKTIWQKIGFIINMEKAGMEPKKKKPMTLGINYKENEFVKIVKIVAEPEHIEAGDMNNDFIRQEIIFVSNKEKAGVKLKKKKLLMLGINYKENEFVKIVKIVTKD